MRLGRSLLWTAAIQALFASSAVAAGCDGMPDAPIVEVSVAPPHPSEPSIVPATETVIRSRAASTGTALPGDAATRGITIDRTEARAELTLARVERGEERCVALSVLHGEVRSTELSVLIDRSYPPGSCQYEAILAHERQHVRISREALEHLASLLERRLRQVAERWSGRWLAAGQEKQMRDEVDRALTEATSGASEQADQRNRTIDSPETYAAVQAKCGRW